MLFTKFVSHLNNQISFLYFVFTIYFIFFYWFWFHCRPLQFLLCFFFGFLWLCFLFSSFSPFSFTHPIFPLHFLFYSLFFFSDKSSNLKHLFVWFVHFYQIIWRSLVLNLFRFKLIQNTFYIILCHFVCIHLSLNLFLLFWDIFWHSHIWSTMHTII